MVAVGLGRVSVGKGDQDWPEYVRSWSGVVELGPGKVVIG